MQAIMVEEGMDFYYTPLEAWLSKTLLNVHKRGGKAILLSQYENEKEASANDLMNRLEELNKKKPWQQ